jgi:hypothetical protein
MTRLGLALILGLAVVSAGCGGGDDKPTATSSDAAELHVLQVWDESVGLYVEGARSYVRVETVAGDEVVELELESTQAGYETRILLDPGRYRLLSWQRPSAGGGDIYDPPTDRCDEAFEIFARTPAEAAIEVRAGQGCAIRFEQGTG